MDLSSPEQEYKNHTMPTERLMNPIGVGIRNTVSIGLS